MIRRLAIAVTVSFACAKGTPGPDVSAAPVTTHVTFGSVTSGNAYSSGMSLDRTAETVGVSAAIAAPVDQVFAALVVVYRELKVPLMDANQAQRMLGNQSLKSRRSIGGVPMQNYMDCGGQPGQPNEETFDLSLSLMSYVTAGSDGGSTLTTRFSGFGSDPNHGQGNQMHCSSTGELEARIAKMVKLQLVK
jgi:hypothetical protein